MTTLPATDNLAASLTHLYAAQDVLSATVRADGDQVRVICPQGQCAALARLLYQAADTLADRAPEVTP